MNIALFICGALALVAFALVGTGVYLLAGLGWALITAGVFALGAAEVLRRGMTGGQ
jgi:hypothetical protein